jgi:hypothetical protein
MWPEDLSTNAVDKPVKKDCGSDASPMGLRFDQNLTIKNNPANTSS